MQQGDYVLVRAFRAQPLIRRVWEWDRDKVWIVDETNYQRLTSLVNGLALRALWPVAFPRSDVFRYDPDLVPRIEADPSIWAEAQPLEAG